MPFKGQLTLLSLVCHFAFSCRFCLNVSLPFTRSRPLSYLLSVAATACPTTVFRRRTTLRWTWTPQILLELSSRTLSALSSRLDAFSSTTYSLQKSVFSSLYIAREMASFLIECCFASLLRKCEAVALNPLVQCDGFVLVFKTN